MCLATISADCYSLIALDTGIVEITQMFAVGKGYTWYGEFKSCHNNLARPFSLLTPWLTVGSWYSLCWLGNGGMSTEEYKTHMAFWAILKAPLLLGNDLTKMTKDILAILTNAEVLILMSDGCCVTYHAISASCHDIIQFALPPDHKS